MKMDLTQTKAVVLVMLGMIKLISGLVPLLLTKILKKRNRRILRKFIGVVLCFGGGVLLSTVFVHMMSEVRESLERATSLGMLPEDVEFPFAELLFCIGFLLILLIESVVHKMCGHDHHHHSDSSSYDTTDNNKEVLPVTVDKVNINIPRLGLDNQTYDNSDKSKKIVQPQFTTTEHPDVTLSRRSSIGGNVKISRNVYNVTNPSPTSSISYSSDSDSISTDPSSLPSTDNISNSKKKSENNVLSSLRSLLVVLALSVHSLFEGMAIGLEETESGVWKLFLAISIHSTAIVFCIGTEMISTGTKKSKIIIYMIILSLVTPAGVLLGILLTVHMEQANGGHILLVGVLQGLAGGTLLYITFFEVLAQEKLRKYGMSGLLGALMIMIGFTMMTMMEASAGGHSHGGHGGHGGHKHSHGHGVHEISHGNEHVRSTLGHGHGHDISPVGHSGHDSGYIKHKNDHSEHFGHKHSNHSDHWDNYDNKHSDHSGHEHGDGNHYFEEDTHDITSSDHIENGTSGEGYHEHIDHDHTNHKNNHEHGSHEHSFHDSRNIDHSNHNHSFHNHDNIHEYHDSAEANRTNDHYKFRDYTDNHRNHDLNIHGVHDHEESRVNE